MVDASAPQHQRLMVHAARRYYLDDASKVAIAEELDISRFKVARLLEEARDQGIVRIDVVDPGAGCEHLERRLRDAFGLAHAVVVDVEELETDAAQDELARRGADLMRRLAQPTDVIGLPWSRMVAKAVRHFDGLPPVPIVQLSGALDLPAYESSPVDVVRDAARLTGGEPRVFYAPLVATDAEAARVIRAQTAVAGTLDEARHCSLALVGIGGWSEGESTLYDLATEDERTLFFDFLPLDLGSVRRMGPGMFPVAVGIILALFGIAIMIPAFFRQGTFEEIEIRSTLAVLASIAAFAMVIRPYGLIPAIAALVLVAALAERTFRPVSILASIVVMATLAWLIFKAGLGLPLTMARWPH